MSGCPVFSNRSVCSKLSPVILMAFDECCLDPLFHQGLQNDNFLFLYS